jgi:hypothetical protein
MAYFSLLTRYEPWLELHMAKLSKNSVTVLWRWDWQVKYKTSS